MYIYIYIYIYVLINVNFLDLNKVKQDKNLNCSFPNEKGAAQVGLETTTYYLLGRRSTN